MNRRAVFLLSISFITGFSVMTIELVASRIVSPIIGNSLYTWTSIIGVILLGLSIGSIVGGIIADKNRNKYLSIQFLLCSLSSFLIIFVSKVIENLIDPKAPMLLINLFVSATLFLLPAILLGTIQPVILKIYSEKYEKIGSEYGSLTATWSIGSILGVFTTGFYLIATFGSMSIITGVSTILLFLSLLFSKKRILVLLLLLILPAYIIDLLNKYSEGNIIFNKETSYYNIKVIDTKSPTLGDSRILFLDIDSHSVQSNKIIESYYTEVYPLFSILNENIKDALFIGAGAYTMPKHMAEYYDNLNITVLEIDSELERVAIDYFNLGKYPSIKTIISDARIFIKNTEKKYDLIFGDAYNSFISVPYHLMTLEFNKQIKGHLNDGGIYAINIIASKTGLGEELFNSVSSTFTKIFPNSFAIFWQKDERKTQNITFIGINSEKKINIAGIKKQMAINKTHGFIAEKIFAAEEESGGIILTDDFSPTENMLSPLIKEYFPFHIRFLNSIK